MKLHELLQQMELVRKKIGASPFFICGGTPRDKFMGRLDNVADIDITTGDKTVDYLSQEFAIVLKKTYNVTRKTMDDGHSTIFIGNLKVDFSSNFMVHNIDNYLNEMGIQKPTDMQREMYSRDFTCNSLLLTTDLKKLLDPTKRGFKDIKDKKIRTCLSPQITLTSNRNRVVRAIYLASKLGFDIDDSIVDYVRQYPDTIRISTEKVMNEKLNQAFEKDPERATHYIDKMRLWNFIPITEVMQPYYEKSVAMTSKKAYYLGGGGVNEPTPGKKKYKSDPAITVQPHFVEPFYKNYDLYTIPGMEDVGPGTGYHGLQNYKSVKDFLEDRRKRLSPRYVADDSWQLDDGTRVKKNPVQARITILERIIKLAVDENDGPNFDYGKGLYSNMDKYKSVKNFEERADKSPGAFFADDNDDNMMGPKEHGTSIYDWKNSPYQGTPKAPKKDTNHIDFPLDDYPDISVSQEGEPGPYGNSDQLGFTEQYMHQPDTDGKLETELDFGNDLTDEAPIGRHYLQDDDNFDFKRLEEKYNPAEAEIYGLPDGVDPEGKDADQTIQIENPDYGTPDSGRQMYEDKWNI